MKTNQYLLEKAVEIAMIERDYNTSLEFDVNVMVAYHLLEKYGEYKMKNGMTYHKEGYATRA